MSICSAPPPPSTSDGEAEARKRRRIRFSNATPAEIDAGIWDMPAVNSAPKWGRGVIIVHHDDSESRAAVRATYPASAWRPPPTKNAVSLAIKGASTEDSGVNGLTAHRPLASSTVDPASTGRSSETANALDASSLSTTDDRDVGGLTLTEPEATQQVSGSTGLTAHRTAHRTRASSMVDPVSPGRSSETTSALDSSSLSTTDGSGGNGVANTTTMVPPIVQGDCESDASMSQTITEVTPDVTSTGVQNAVRHANDDVSPARIRRRPFV